MIKNKLFFLLLLLIIAGHNTIAQKPTVKSYVILAVEDFLVKALKEPKSIIGLLKQIQLKLQTLCFTHLYYHSSQKQIWKTAAME
jgi:hypothetical protein